MKPVILSEKPLIRAYNCDCMDLMAGNGDGFWDLAITDPPYGLQKSGNLSRMNSAGKLANRVINTRSCEFDLMPPGEEYFTALFRTSENQIIWGGNYFNLPPTRGIICWDKEQPWPNFSAWEMAWTSFDYPSKLFRFNNKGFRGEGKSIHPTQKPVALYLWLLTNYAKPGDTILDTHGGSFSSAIACWKMNYNLDIVELDSEYFEAACSRFERETRQGSMFTENLKRVE